VAAAGPRQRQAGRRGNEDQQLFIDADAEAEGGVDELEQDDSSQH